MSSFTMPFGIVGVFSCIGLVLRQLANKYPRDIMAEVIWAQVAGCFLIGYFTSQKDFLSIHYPHLVAGLNAGLCGSFTSFSQFMSTLWFAFGGSVSKGPGFDLLNGTALIMLVIGLSNSAFEVGGHLGTIPAFQFKNFEKSTENSIFKTIFSEPLAYFYLAVIFSFAIVAAIYSPFKVGAIAIFFAPLGSYARIYLSRYNGDFPWGTLWANWLGCIIMYLLLLIQYQNLNGYQCSIVIGMNRGLCGSLTTISTFIGELRRLKLSYSYTYGIVSIAGAQLLAIGILGSYKWSGNHVNICQIDGKV
jgi:CrcB protein